ncbi:uncharacterized protein LOC129789048 [Lutzomyia longipalpis]|uniref:uncharacterized protein LOC129789048 n=1 Tax=Lutzomyia longipalpis TaxID=7200 RepID=UPI002484585B|nr:uncharacterized protein LOC129789048 [Lutzomyia longipalpis]
MTLVEILPELFASLCYMQCGSWLMFMLSLPTKEYSHLLVGPQICGMASAGLTGLLLTHLRYKYRSVKFVHFLLLAIGTALFTVCSLILVIRPLDSPPGIYFGGLGHGIVYITGLSYIHFRSSADGKRIIRMGMCHFMNILGMAIMAHLGADVFKEEVKRAGGWIILIEATLAIIVLIINEILHLKDFYNYRECLDGSVKEANMRRDNFQSAIGVVSETPHDAPNTHNQLKLTVLSVSMKITNAMLTHIPFVYFTNIAIANLLEREKYLEFMMFYFAVIGMILSMLMSLKFSIRFIYMNQKFAIIPPMIIGFSLMTAGRFSLAAVGFWFFFMHLGQAAFCPDVSILELSDIRYSELMLSLGYCVESIITAITLFLFHQYPSAMQFDNLVAAMWTNFGIFGPISLILLLSCRFLKLSATTKKSILDIQRLVLFGPDPQPLPVDSISELSTK